MLKLKIDPSSGRCAELYGVKQSLTCPYSPRGNAHCERFNHTKFRPLHMLSKEQKAKWSIHLPLLVFAYNVTPHSTTGFQPYQLMLGHKAPSPCDNWLGLGEYNIRVFPKLPATQS